MESLNILHWPVNPKTTRINQRFGENKACVSKTNPRDFITCDGNNAPKGYRSVYGPDGHLGLDLSIYRGQEIYNAQNGVVVFIDTQERTGLDVRVLSKIDGENYLHIYEHLQGMQVKVGDKVKTGQLLGWGDNTGWSSGDHLHFQVVKGCDDNGNGGTPIDPLSVLSEQFAKNVLAINNSISYIMEQIALLADSIGDYLRRKS